MCDYIYQNGIVFVCACIYMFLNERWEGRKKEASKVKQTNKAKQHSTPMYVCVCWAITSSTIEKLSLYMKVTSHTSGAVTVPCDPIAALVRLTAPQCVCMCVCVCVCVCVCMIVWVWTCTCTIIFDIFHCHGYQKTLQWYHRLFGYKCIRLRSLALPLDSTQPAELPR